MRYIRSLMFIWCEILFVEVGVIGCRVFHELFLRDDQKLASTGFDHLSNPINLYLLEMVIISSDIS